MIKHFVYTFPRTIYQQPEDTAFPLDPWNSLDSDMVYRHLSTDIALIFERKKDSLFISHKHRKLAGILGHWFLTLPRRSYTPPQFPHFQLWYMDKTFTPSLAFLPPAKRQMLGKITGIIKNAMQSWQLLPKSSFFFGFNSTPFSFVRRPDGLYWSGGQSVRAFHLSYLCLPRTSRMERIFVPERKLGLVYPLNFSQELFKFWFRLPNLQNHILSKKRYRYSFNARGLVITIPGNSIAAFTDAWALMSRIDKIAYQIQLITIYSLYKRSEHFLDSLDRLLSATDVGMMDKHFKQLALVFEGRALAQAHRLLLNSLLRLDGKYGDRAVGHYEKNWNKVKESLVLTPKHQPASFLSQKRYVLRPGMGYGYLAKTLTREINLRVMPLDTLLPKGIVEANGYFFQKKIIRHSRPPWFEPIKKAIWQNKSAL